MKLREHRGGFLDSLSTIVVIEPTLEAVAKLVNAKLGPHQEAVPPEKVHVKP